MKGTQAPAGYERSDADPRRLVLAGLLLAVLLGASLAVSAWISQTTDAEIVRGETTSPVRGLRTAPSGPELQAIPARELALVRAREERLLTGTEWVDPVNGVVRIPIERALELSLQEGFPTRAEARK
jgi:hypothetical protein